MVRWIELLIIDRPLLGMSQGRDLNIKTGGRDSEMLLRVVGRNYVS